MSGKITIEKWNERVKNINPDMELLNQTEPYGTKEDPYLLHCKKCDYIASYTRGMMHYINGHKRCDCKMCSDGISFPNRICRALLTQLPVEQSEPEYIRKWTKGRYYDGYFLYNDIEYLLEFDGKQHSSDSSWNSLEYQQKIDLEKDILADNNGFVLIRIDCKITTFEYIKEQIYNSLLSEIFNLDDIDWDQILKMSMGNMFWKIVDYYKKHMDMHNVDIGKVFNIDRHTVKNYLKKAIEMGLIEYKVKKMSKSVAEKLTEIKRNNSVIKFSVYDPDNNYLGDFKMYSDCEKFLNNKYQDKTFYDGNIENALLSNKKYHGFSFRFSEDSIIRNYEDKKLIDICNYFIKNQQLSNTQIAKEFNTYRKHVERCLYRGLASGIIKIEDFTEDAFKIHRFKELREQYNIIKKGVI